MLRTLAPALALAAVPVAAPPAAADAHIGQCTFAASTGAGYDPEPTAYGGEFVVS